MTIAVRDVAVPDPGDDEIVVRVEAAPINPSDLFLLLGPADVSTLTPGGSPEYPTLAGKVPPARLGAVRGRLGITMPVGNEGAGTVVAAGKNATDLMGKAVGMVGGAMFADYRKIGARDVVPIPPGATAADDASMFINPLTALGFVETMRMEGYHAIVHTAAASNLGKILIKVCREDGIPLNWATATIVSIRSRREPNVHTSAQLSHRSRQASALRPRGGELACLATCPVERNQGT